MGVRAPAEMSRVVKDFLHAHLEDHIGMGTYPYTFRRHVPQQRIEDYPVLSRKKRINPDKDAIAAEKLLAHLIRHIIGIDRRLRFNAERGHFLENATKSILMWRCRVPLRDVPRPQQRQFYGPLCRHIFPLKAIFAVSGRI